MDDLGLRGGAWPLPVDWRGDARRFARDLDRLPVLAEAARRRVENFPMAAALASAVHVGQVFKEKARAAEQNDGCGEAKARVGRAALGTTVTHGAR